MTPQLQRLNATRRRNSSGDIIVIFTKFYKEACWYNDGCIKTILKI